VNDNIDNPEWDVTGHSMKIGSFLNFGFELTELKLSVSLDRKHLHYVYFIILPGIANVLISFSSFWIEIDQAVGRVSLTIIPIFAATSMINSGY
jgi:hypothetical protein